MSCGTRRYHPILEYMHTFSRPSTLTDDHALGSSSFIYYCDLGRTCPWVRSRPYELTDQYCPSLVGGWLFGFSSYEIGQLCGHLALNFVACLPALLWLGVLRYKGRIGRRVFFVASSITLVFLEHQPNFSRPRCFLAVLRSL